MRRNWQWRINDRPARKGRVGAREWNWPPGRCALLMGLIAAALPAPMLRAVEGAAGGKKTATTAPVSASAARTEAEMREAAEKGEVAAHFELARHLEKRGAPVKSAEADTVWRLMQAAAEQDHAPAMLWLALEYEAGKRVEKDEKTAFQWALKAAEKGSIHAMFLTAENYRREVGTEKNMIESTRWMEAAAEAGHPEGMLEYASMLATKPNGTTEEREESQKWLEKAAAKNSPMACMMMGRVAQGDTVLDGVGKPDFPQARAFLRRAGCQGISIAFLHLAMMHRKGNGVPQDDVEAQAWLLLAAAYQNAQTIELQEGHAKRLTKAQQTRAAARAKILRTELDAELKEIEAQRADDLTALVSKPAGANEDPSAKPPTKAEVLAGLVAKLRADAEAGDPAAQVRLGQAFLKGDGLTKDLAAARKWFLAAARQGHAEGQLEYGLCLEFGAGGDKDETAAAGWFRKAADQGNAKGMFWLSHQYALGQGGLPRDLELCHGWTLKAAKLGLPEAKFMLSKQYRTGRGAGKDIAAADRWLKEAAEGGSASAQVEVANRLVAGKAPDSPVWREAVLWFDKAAQQKDVNGMLQLGVCHALGRGVKEHGPKALYWLRKVAVAGNREGCHYTGLMYCGGWGVARDPVEGYAWLLLNLDSKDPKAAEARKFNGQDMTQKQLAAAEKRSSEILADLQVEQQRVDAGEPYLPPQKDTTEAPGESPAPAPLAKDSEAADASAPSRPSQPKIPTMEERMLAFVMKSKGYIEAQNLRGPPQHVPGEERMRRLYGERGAAKLKEAAADGNANAMADLGQCYLTGDGVQKDPEEGLRWLEAAVKEHSARGLLHLSRQFSVNGHLPRNEERAAELTKKAADMLLVEAQLHMAERCALGMGVPKDLEAAMVWLRKAANQTSFVPAMLMLGEVLSMKAEDSETEETAYGWFEEAAKLGDAEAKHRASERLRKGGQGVKRDLVQAMTWLREAAEAGFTDAEYEYGRTILQANDERTKQYAEGIEYMKKAAAKNHAGACAEMGVRYLRGDSVRKDAKLALQHLQVAAEFGLSTAYGFIGMLYRDGLGVPEDAVEAQAYLILSEASDIEVLKVAKETNGKRLTAAQRKQAEARAVKIKAEFQAKYDAKTPLDAADLNLLAVLRLAEKDEPDLPAVLENAVSTSLRKSAAAGDAEAQYRLGLALKDGKEGLTKDEAEARKWLLAAAEQEHEGAQVQAGHLLFNGIGGPVDPEAAGDWFRVAAAQHKNVESMLWLADQAETPAESFSWTRKAADEGDPAAKYALSTFYRGGIAVERDIPHADDLLREAATSGHPEAQAELGLRLTRNPERDKDMQKEGYEWVSKAAEQKVAVAMLEVGLCKMLGRGVKVDDADAVNWMLRAAESGEKSALAYIGLSISFGIGRKADLVEGYAWLVAAGREVKAEHVQRREELKKMLTKSQLLGVAHRVRELQRQYHLDEDLAAGQPKVEKMPVLDHVKPLAIAQQKEWQEVVVDGHYSVLLPPNMVILRAPGTPPRKKKGPIRIPVDERAGVVSAYETGLDPDNRTQMVEAAQVRLITTHNKPGEYTAPSSSLLMSAEDLGRLDESLRKKVEARKLLGPKDKVLHWEPVQVREVNDADAVCLASRRTLITGRAMRTYEYHFTNHDCSLNLGITFPEEESEQWEAVMATIVDSLEIVQR